MKRKKGINISHLDIRDNQDKPIETFTDLQKANLDATCDCGIDCCKGELVLKDKVTNQPVRLSVSDGELSVGQSEVGGAGYKVYTALLSQSGTNAPTAVVLENTLGGTVVWTRFDVGNYIGTLSLPIVPTKSLVAYNRVTLDDAGILMVAFIGDSTSVSVYTMNSSNYSIDSGLFSSFIEIRVYP